MYSDFTDDPRFLNEVPRLCDIAAAASARGLLLRRLTPSLHSSIGVRRPELEVGRPRLDLDRPDGSLDIEPSHNFEAGKADRPSIMGRCRRRSSPLRVQ